MSTLLNSKEIPVTNNGGTANAQRYKIETVLNSQNVSNNTSNITITFYVEAIETRFTTWADEDAQWTTTSSNGASIDNSSTIRGYKGTPEKDVWYSFGTYTGNFTHKSDGSLTVNTSITYGWDTSTYYVPKITTISTGDVTVPAFYTVSYNANGGSTTPSAQKCKAGESITLSSAISRANSGNDYNYATYTATFASNGGNSTPSSQTSYRKGYYTYTFSKWGAGSSSGTKYSAGSTYTPTGNVTMYAVWTQSSLQPSSTYTSITIPAAITRNNSGNNYNYATYTTSFNANGGSSTLSSLTSYRKGYYTYTFASWSGYSPNAVIYPTSSATYTAQWTQSSLQPSSTYTSITLPSAISRNNGTATITTSFNTNGGSSVDAKTSTSSTPYTFSKWALGSTGGTKYSAGASYTPTSSQTFYATWTAGTTTYSSITLPSTTKDGNAFKGWYNSNGALIGLSGASYTPTASATLNAYWDALRFIKINNVWKQANNMYIKVNGQWKTINTGYVKVNGLWKV